MLVADGMLYVCTLVSMCVWLFLTHFSVKIVITIEQRLIAIGTRTQLDSSIIRLVKSTRSSRRPSRSAVGTYEYCRNVCATILFSTHGAANIRCRGRRASGCIRRQGNNDAVVDGCHGCGEQVCAFQISVSFFGGARARVGALSAIVVFANVVARCRGGV